MGISFLRADEIAAKPTEWFWPGRIPMGGLTVVEGDPGAAKSSLLADLAARETQGLTMPGSDIAGTGGDVLWISDEDAPDTLRRNLTVAGADLGKVRIYDKGSDQRLVLPAEAGQLKQVIIENRCRLVVLDPITAFLNGSTNAENVIRAALSPLTAVAEETGAAIVLVRHLRKGGGSSALFRGMGSIGLIAAARSGLLVAKEPEVGIASTQGGRRVVAQFKSNLGPLSDSLGFQIGAESGGVRIEWVGPSDYTADQLQAPTGAGESTALADACHVLYSLLGEGPVCVGDVTTLANRNGVAARTLQRAKKELSVKSVRDGFGKGSKYFWVLPEKNELLARLIEQDLTALADELFNSTPEQSAAPPQDDCDTQPSPRVGKDRPNDRGNDLADS